MQIDLRRRAVQNPRVSDYKSESLAYLDALVKATGLTATELARTIGVAPSTLTRPMNKETHKYAVKFQTLQALAKKHAFPLPDTLTAAQGVAKGRARAALGETTILPIRHEVAASGFVPRDELIQGHFGLRRVPTIPEYAGCPQWLERVVSDSMDRRVPVNAIVHVVDAIALEYRPAQGDIVIVERTYDQGSMVERTMKEVALTPDGVELRPNSHNSRWKAAIPLVDGEASEDTTVQIVGLVAQAYIFPLPEVEEDAEEAA